MASKTAIVVGALLLVGAGTATALYVNGTDGAPAALANAPACAYDKLASKLESFREKHPDKPDHAEKALGKLADRCGKPHRGGPGGVRAEFEKDGASVTGRFVSFTETETGLADYASRGPWADALVFDSVTVDGLPAEGAIQKRGYVREADGLRLVAFNSPNAGLMVGARDGATVTYDLADGVVASAGENGTVVLERDGHRAHLKARNGALEIGDGVVTATLDADGAVAFAIGGYPGELAKEKAAFGGGMHRPGRR